MIVIVVSVSVTYPLINTLARLMVIKVIVVVVIEIVVIIVVVVWN